jgi:hypothetical protein
MKANLAAINVICEEKVVNTNGVPLLFYWNGETDILEDIRKSEDFKQWLADEFILEDLNKYLKSYISFFYYKSNDEDYQELKIPMQELYSMDYVSTISDKLLQECVQYLYDKSFPHVDELMDGLLDLPLHDRCLEMIEKILEKYNGRISKDTCRMAMRGYIQEHYPDLTMSNLDIFMGFADKVIFI